ncbi:MAG: hypothetical protein H6R04_587 [Burkholderiaceae bacterium]|nr:hypothetical protein [Burkholderiaceae bacterium]
MDDLKTIAPFLLAINQVVQDAPAFREDETGLDRHFQVLLQREITKQVVHLPSDSQESPIIQFPANSTNQRPKTVPNNNAIGSFATPIRSLHTCPLLPNELMHGWYGRMRAINALPEKASMSKIIADAACKHDPSLISDANAVHHAASILKIAYDVILERHTLTPFFYAIKGLKHRTPNGKSKPHRRAYDQHAPLRLDGAHPRFCTQCAKEDVEKMGFSYWRSEHQLTGVLWCTRHGTQLSSARQSSAFSICPHQVIDLITDDKLSTLSPSQAEILRKYTYLATEILRQAPTIEGVAASALLGDWAKAQNLRTTKVGKRSTVSSVIFSSMPNWWLTENFPRTRWAKNNWIRTVDGACSPRTGRFSSSTLCLLAAVLCDNVEEAEKILWPRPTSKAKQLGTDFWASKAVLNLYIANKGVVNGIGEALNLPNGSAAFGLTRQGLPGLGNTSSATLDAIQAFLNGESSLENISCQYNAPIRELEYLLRQGCARLKFALNTMAKQADASVFSQRHTAKKQRFRSIA